MSVKKNDDSGDEIIEQIINLLKEHPVIKKMFAKFNVSLDNIHKIPICFKALDVSAKAKNGRIYLNESFLDDGNFIDDVHYIVHEITHILQQITGQLDDSKCYDEDNYLDDPAEIEAFRNQINFIDNYKNPKEADKYVDELLDFHDLRGKERAIKRQQLRSQ